MKEVEGLSVAVTRNGSEGSTAAHLNDPPSGQHCHYINRAVTVLLWSFAQSPVSIVTIIALSLPLHPQSQHYEMVLDKYFVSGAV